MSEQEATVKANIHEAFATTPRPSDGYVVIADPGEDPECDEIVANFQGKRWREVPAEIIQYHADSLPLLTPSAFRYYLPAYMLASLEPSSAGLDSADLMNFVVLRLVPPEAGEDPEYFMARARQFSPEERLAMASYLKLAAKRQEAEWGGDVPKLQGDEVDRAIRFWQSPRGL